jgi:hypothetical protein
VIYPAKQALESASEGRFRASRAVVHTATRCPPPTINAEYSLREHLRTSFNYLINK